MKCFLIRGRKGSGCLSHAFLGYWEYVYNAFGELIGQTDAKGQSVTMKYDRLGRLTERTEPEGTSTWEYDSVAGFEAGKSVGKLVKVTGPDNYRQTQTYDTLGRAYSVAS